MSPGAPRLRRRAQNGKRKADKTNQRLEKSSPGCAFSIRACDFLFRLQRLRRPLRGLVKSVFLNPLQSRHRFDVELDQDSVPLHASV